MRGKNMNVRNDAPATLKDLHDTEISVLAKVDNMEIKLESKIQMLSNKIDILCLKIDNYRTQVDLKLEAVKNEVVLKLGSFIIVIISIATIVLRFWTK
jgi:hypothetical protein